MRAAALDVLPPRFNDEDVLGLPFPLEEDDRGARLPCLAVTGPCFGISLWGGGEREATRWDMSALACWAATDVRIGIERERLISSRDTFGAPQAFS